MNKNLAQMLIMSSMFENRSYWGEEEREPKQKKTNKINSKKKKLRKISDKSKRRNR